MERRYLPPQEPVRRLLAGTDWVLVAMALGLSLLGLVMVYSATRSWVVGDPAYYLRRQAFNLLAALAGMALGFFYDHRRLLQFSRLVYALGILLLVAVLAAGRRVAGTQGWLDLGPVAVQPAELAKLVLVVALARELGERRIERWQDLVVPVGMAVLPATLVLLQPDLGTAVVFGVILLGMLYAAQAPARYLAWMTGAALAGAAGAVAVSWLGWAPILQPHQLQRLAVFFGRGASPQGAGWNVAQSIIAIGSGRLFGQGLFRGPQTQLAFVPARHTDFIFSAVGEELGFFGAAGAVAAYATLLWRCLAVATLPGDRGGALLATGVAVTLGFHVAINIGMTLGLAPVMGIPLPLLSYGGSSLLATLTGLGMVAGVGARRLAL